MSNKKVWDLKKETEIRCELGENDSLSLRLLTGSAEVFGIEMAPNKEYIFKDANVAVFTWYGCSLESSGDDSGLYVADSTPMVAYVNTHVQLEARRDVALANKDYGPRVMLVGPTDHGKSSTSQILAAYAVRLDRAPIFVDLDVGQGMYGVPGCMCAVPLDRSSLNVEEGLCSATPLVFFHGYNSPKENVELYKALATNLANKVNERLKRDIDAKSSGIIVNTCGWIDQGEGFDLLLHCIKAFAIDVVLVMNHDKLYSNLRTSLHQMQSQQQQQQQNGGKGGGKNNNRGGSGTSGSNSSNTGVVVVKLPRSGGVVTRGSTTRKRLRKVRTKEYFYGRLHSPTATSLSPIRKEAVQISSFTFLRAGGIRLSEGMRVVGDSSHQDSWKLAKISLTPDLAYSVVAVLHPLESSSEHAVDGTAGASDRSGGSGSSGSGQIATAGDVTQELMTCNVAGFVSIVQVDTENDSMTLLCPCPGSLPSNVLLVGAIKWME